MDSKYQAEDKEILKYFSPIRIWRRNVFCEGALYLSVELDQGILWQD